MYCLWSEGRWKPKHRKHRGKVSPCIHSDLLLEKDQGSAAMTLGLLSMNCQFPKPRSVEVIGLSTSRCHTGLGLCWFLGDSTHQAVYQVYPHFKGSLKSQSELRAGFASPFCVILGKQLPSL